MSEPTVAASFARGLLDFAASKGANPTMLAERAGIDPADLQDADNRVPFAKYVVCASDKNALLLSGDAWMTQKPPSASRVVLDVLSERAEALLDGLENAKSMTGRVQSLLMPMLHTGEVIMDVIAGKLGVS